MTPQDVPRFVPLIEIADHADADRVRRPNGEIHARHPGHAADVSAQPLVGSIVLAFAQQVQIVAGKQGREGVRIFDHLHPPVLVGHAQPIFLLLLVAGPRADGLVQSGRMHSPHRQRRLVPRMHHPDLPRFGQEHPYRRELAALCLDLVWSQDFRRIRAGAIDDRADVTQRQLRAH